MRESYEIFESLKSSFLSTQNSIESLQPGSIINSLLYSNSVELAKVFSEVDLIKENFYIDKATGTYLDLLISGFAKLDRSLGSPSIGYVLIELGTPLTLENIDNFKFSFARYNEDGTISSNYENVVRFTVNNKNSRSADYVVISPLNFDFPASDFELVSVGNEQNLLGYYKSYLKVLLNKYKKPIKYLVLPVASIENGSFNNVASGSIDIAVNIGFPCLVKNPYNFSGDAYLAYKTLKVLNTQSDSIMADVDNIVVTSGDSYGLGEFSYVSGGTDEETDELYRARYYSFLNSLSGGTIEAIRNTILEQFPNAQISIVETNNPGSIDVFVDSISILSRPILQRILESIDEVKPAGIYVNIKPTKNTYVSILADISTESFKDAVNSIRTSVSTAIDSKSLGETLSYDEIFSLLSDPNISKKDNIFYGEYLNPILFNMYKETFQKLYYKFGVKFGENWNTIQFQDVYDAVSSSPETIYIAYKNSGLNYPLVSLVKRAFEMNDVEKSSLSGESLGIVNKILEVCTEKKVYQCINNIMYGSGRYSDYEDSLPTNIGNLPIGEKISLANIEEIVSKEYATYFKAKLMTIPLIKKEIVSVASQLIKKVLLNDINYLSYDELLEAKISSLEKIKIARDFVFSFGVYDDASLVTARPSER